MGDTSSHNEKEIYDGCLALMKQMTRLFYEYLNIIGFNVEDLTEDEQFVANFSPTEVVERLFL